MFPGIFGKPGYKKRHPTKPSSIKLYYNGSALFYPKERDMSGPGIKTAAMVAALFTSAIFGQGSPIVKWACIGNSITAGAYPQKLAALLGPGYIVENDGIGGTTMLKSGRRWSKKATSAFPYPLGFIIF
jgi:hypothetical protein